MGKMIPQWPDKPFPWTRKHKLQTTIAKYAAKHAAIHEYTVQQLPHLLIAIVLYNITEHNQQSDNKNVQ